jgi:DNA helicase HerA-like ATPase
MNQDLTVASHANSHINLELSKWLKNFHWEITRGFIDTIESDKISFSSNEIQAPKLDNLQLLKITSLKFRKRHELKDSLSTLYKVLYSLEQPFIYIFRAKQNLAELYIGLFSMNQDEGIATKVKGAYKVMRSTLPGVLPGSQFMEITDQKRPLLNEIFEFNTRQVITGVPTAKESTGNPKNEQNIVAGIERLLDSMGGDDFALVIIAVPVGRKEIAEFSSTVASWHDEVHAISKASLSYTRTHGETKSSSKSWSYSKSEGKSISSGRSWTETPGFGERVEKGFKNFIFGGQSATIQKQEQEGITEQETSAEQEQKQKGTSDQESKGLTREITIKMAAELEDIINRVLLRIQEGSGAGMWKTAIQIMAHNPYTCKKASNIFRGIISGPKSNIDPLRSFPVKQDVQPFMLVNPAFLCYKDHPFGMPYQGLWTYLTTSELAMAADIPLYDLPSLQVEEIVEYGRFQPQVFQSNNSIRLGQLMDRGSKTQTEVRISLNQLNRHCFVSGATGSGKSNTVRTLIRRLWQDHKIPFLVLDPIKSEYNCLKEYIPELDIYTLGHPGSTSFSLNPFSFEPQIGLVTHIDYLKAGFNALLGSYSTMPHILEDILYQVYEKAGWDSTSGKNAKLEKVLTHYRETLDSDTNDLFLPRLADMVPLVGESIAKFFPHQTDYAGSLLGALRARITSLTRGAKGFLLNTRKSIPTQKLLAKPCIIELWPFADNDEKAFVMALILIKLYEYRQSLQFSGQSTSGLQHVLVIEEAHRLLAKTDGGSELTGHGRQKGVEVFADILAEIRSYGQGIIVVDQIPAKLVPDVLKNTDIKIAHRIVAKDDRESLGAAMTLDKNQNLDLAKLVPGQVTVYFEGLSKPLSVMVDLLTDRDVTEIPENVDCSPEQLPVSAEPPNILDIDANIVRNLVYLINGLLIVALADGREPLLATRSAIQDHLLNNLQMKNMNDLQPIMSASLYELSEELQASGLASGMAAYIISLIKHLLKDYLDDKPIDDQIIMLRSESKGMGIIVALSEKVPFDLLDIFLGNYLRWQGVRFFDTVAQALRNSVQGDRYDWQNLYTILFEHVAQATLSIKLSDPAKINLALRFLTRLPSKNQELARLAGLATGVLRSLIQVEQSVIAENL